ncbi:two-component system sensor histidine kinase BaeS [Martelella alba]|uniref:histidine kinase n=1 Tax=Martelella alba TaxID=2590451 RepID=A0ABY2SLP8_9HYPH|nr:two-component system sensor histidine kinase BaeS [Martelella alba]TKI06698.1 two-component system sensor histidine kinase BaeS [Martelella alba]
MKFGITAKLFLALFATSMLVVITMNWGVRLSFERGFIDYIKRTNHQRMVLLDNALTEQYQVHGDWGFLRNNERFVFQLLRSFEQNPDEGRNYPPHGLRTQIWVVDADMTKLVGPAGPLPNEGPRLPITANHQVVGWIMSTPVERLTRAADISFDAQQRRTSWLIVALAGLLAAAVAWLTARGLLAPVQRLVKGTHQLAAGNFSVRVVVDTQDELARLARDFNQLAMSLEKNDAMRREFMADISHELRTPLAILRGELEALQDGVRKPTGESLASLQGEVAILTKLVDDLYQLSLSDSGALAYRKSRVDVIHLLKIAVAAFHERYIHKGIDICLEMPDQAPVFGDPDRLTQLFNNLLENSLRYTDPPGRLVITGQIRDEMLSLCWQDSAPGVDDGQLLQIFDRFYRTEGSRNRASGGSGLGLSICQNIVEAHAGSLKAAHSTLGGLRIALLLPIDTRPVRSL